MAYNFNLTQNNPWLGFAQDNPQGMFNAFIPKGTRSFMDYWQSQYGKQYGNYMGNITSTALGGNAPTQNFEDYLNSYDWMGNWNALAPQQRGERTSSRYRWNL